MHVSFERLIEWKITAQEVWMCGLFYMAYIIQIGLEYLHIEIMPNIIISILFEFFFLENKDQTMLIWINMAFVSSLQNWELCLSSGNENICDYDIYNELKTTKNSVLTIT